MSGGRTKGTIGTPLPSSTTPSASTGDDHENSSKAKMELKELVEKAKKTDPKMGLSSTEVLNRQQEFGKNELPEKKISPIMQFLSYLWGPMPIMIWAAIIIELSKAIATKEGWIDFGVSIPPSLLTFPASISTNSCANNRIHLSPILFPINRS